MRAGVTIAGIVMAWATSAGAMMPPLMCENGDAAGEMGGYDRWSPGEGFVTYSAFEQDADNAFLTVLEECASRRQLMLKTETGRVDAALDAAADGMFDEMIWGSDGYTLREMEGRLRDLGAIVEMRTVNYQSCACANQ
jgi:hypothetical protein